MQLGMIGLGRMGSGIVRRLMRRGHQCVVHDVNAAAVTALVDEHATGASSLQELVTRLERPRAMWLMIPAGLVDPLLSTLVPLLEPGDTIIDGGNSFYRDDVRRAGELRARELHYVDVGTSGGVAGLDRGYCLMIGGETAIVQHLAPIFAALAPGADAAPRTPGERRDNDTSEQGYLHCGPHGAGHFVKMIHNGIEYGLMAAYAEGLNILRHARIGIEQHSADAETAPVSDAQFYCYDFDLPAIAEVWRRGSVISSWLLDLTAQTLLEDPELKHFAGRVSDSGEGRWTIAAAIDEAVPVPVLSAALFQRFSSRDNDDFANQVLSAMRSQFGGHKEKPAS
ncbi:MAG TPA: decarboxylating 6-phosphogluconate dehydrogenase [Povalibacter sp.]|nr:decarboxylating 6-phosphogluconate dehydrogenase [Povalibacter sp.]